MEQSKASDATDYVALQIRGKTGTDTFKVQGAGTQANRPYGVSDVITVTPGYGIGEWVNSLPATSKSLAGGPTMYVTTQAAIRGNQIHFQVMGPAFSADNPNELSRDYGAIFNIEINEAPALADFVHSNATGSGGGEFFGTDDDPLNDEGPSTYAPDDKDQCQCTDCGETENSSVNNSEPKTVVIDGITYNISPQQYRNALMGGEIEPFLTRQTNKDNERT